MVGAGFGGERAPGGRRSPDWTAGWRCGTLSVWAESASPNCSPTQQSILLLISIAGASNNMQRLSRLCRRSWCFGLRSDCWLLMVITESPLLKLKDSTRSKQTFELDLCAMRSPMPWPSEPVSGALRRERFWSASATARKDAGGAPPTRNNFPRGADLWCDSLVRPGRQYGHQNVITLL